MRRGRRIRRLPTAEQLQLEGVLLVGGLRALLLQLAHPAVGHGVAARSDFASDPLGRLNGTLEFVYVTAAGDEALQRWAARSVGLAHRPVVSGPAEPVAYDARDVDLQFWVAATIHDTAVRIAETVWGPLPAPLVDELLARNGRIATALGLPVAAWPLDRPAFEARFAEAAAALRFDGTTIAVVEALLTARATPAWVRAAMPLLARATLPTLPGLRPALDPLVSERIPDLLPIARRLAPAVRFLPRALRTLPARRILAAAERSAARQRLDGPGAVGGRI